MFLLDTFPLKEVNSKESANDVGTEVRQIAAKETVTNFNAVKGTRGPITTNKKALAKQKAVKDAAARMKLNNESALAKQVDKKEASAVKTNVKGFYFYFKLSTFTLFINNIYI